MGGCIFCDIVSGELPSEKIYEDTEVLAFLDIHPTNQGHTLVIPKEHYRNILEASDEAACAVTKVIKKLAPSIKEAVGADGINIIYNIDRAAGQIIFHAHGHIIPRYDDDGFQNWKGVPYKKGEIEKVGEKIRSELN